MKPLPFQTEFDVSGPENISGYIIFTTVCNWVYVDRIG